MVLASGGVDSAACIAFHRARRSSIDALFINFGQVAVRRERNAVRRIASYYEVPLTEIAVSSRATFKDGVVNGRNAFFLMLALMHFGPGAGLISLGIHAGTNYYDCSPRFLHAMQNMIRGYTGGTVDVSAPFVKFSKREILQFCEDQAVPVELTYSCELGRDQPCGRCESCRTLAELSVHAGA